MDMVTARQRFPEGFYLGRTCGGKKKHKHIPKYSPVKGLRAITIYGIIPEEDL